MRGLPELLNMVDEIYNTLESPAKVSTESYPILFLQERPVERVKPNAFRGCGRWRPSLTKPQPHSSEKEFSVAFDVSSFKPEEISVKLIDRDIVVEGKHEEREDEHGFVSRKFIRRITIPKDFDTDTVTTYLNNDGKMTVKALKPKPAEVKERIIPIKRIASDELEESATLKKKKELETNGKEDVAHVEE